MGTSSSSIEFLDLGLIDYQAALQRQMELVEQVADGAHSQCVLFCSHPPVVTLGRGTKAGDVFGWQGPIVEISRGGRATYHGPNQLVVYPIIKLSLDRPMLPSRDLHGYLRGLENVISETLAGWDVKAQGGGQLNSPIGSESDDSDSANTTGVWVGERKIASIGIGVRKWVTYHGAAINLDYDPRAFQGLNPCGFKSGTMISLEEILGRKIDRHRFQSDLQSRLIQFFQHD